MKLEIEGERIIFARKDLKSQQDKSDLCSVIRMILERDGTEIWFFEEQLDEIMGSVISTADYISIENTQEGLMLKGHSTREEIPAWQAKTIKPTEIDPKQLN